MNPPAAIRTSITLLTLATALSAGGASAVTIYRCGATGNSYADTPCSGGRAFDADDARSTDQRAEALRVAALDRRLAAELQTERLRAESVPPLRAAGFNARPVPPVATTVVLVTDGRRSHSKRLVTRNRPRWANDDREEFIAYAPPAAGASARGRR